jgi:hypothetical protein
LFFWPQDEAEVTQVKSCCRGPTVNFDSYSRTTLSRAANLSARPGKRVARFFSRGPKKI